MTRVQALRHIEFKYLDSFLTDNMPATSNGPPRPCWPPVCTALAQQNQAEHHAAYQAPRQKELPL